MLSGLFALKPMLPVQLDSCFDSVKSAGKLLHLETEI